MRNKVLALSLLLTLMAGGFILSRSFSNAAGRPQQQDEYLNGEFKIDQKRIEVFRFAKDFDGLIKLGDELEQKWNQLDASRYARLMLNVCQATMGADYMDDRQYTIGRKYVRLALKKADEIPVETETELVLNLGGDAERLQGRAQHGEGEWSVARSERAALWFHAWRRLDAEIDRSFDVNNRPLLNIPAPRGLPIGIAPEAVKNPNLRAEYAEARAANARRAQTYTRQFQLHQLEELFSPKAEKYLVEMYSSAPFNLEELKGRLDSSIKSDDGKKRIIDEVTSRIVNQAMTPPDSQ
ncbi:MAG: hypothetical protein ACR2G4_06505 [Pyrinomonadaceae bacterium]